MKIEKLSSKEYEEFASNHPYLTFHQKEYWGKLKKTNGWNYELVGARRNGKIVGATLLLYKVFPFNLKLFYAPRGFLLDFDDFELLDMFTSAIKRYIKKQKGFMLKIDPYVEYKSRDIDGDIVEGIDHTGLVNKMKELGYQHYGFNKNITKELQPRWLFVLDLKGKTEDKIFADFNRHYRKAIRKALKLGLTVEQVDKSGLEDYKKIMEHTSERRGFVDRPYSYYANMYNIIGDDLVINICYLDLVKGITNLENEIAEIKGYQDIKDNHLEQIAKDEEKILEYRQLQEEFGDRIPLAGTMSIVCGKEYLNLFGGAYERFMKYDAQYLIKWETIKDALNRGSEIYNFYGITGNFDKDNPMYGIYEFKRGFHGRVVELIGEFDLVISRPKYYLYSILIKIYKLVKRIIKR